jgi:DNA-binding transcriptional LysR family regulator
LTLLALVDAGMGVAILPDSLRRLKLGQVGYATLKGPKMVDVEVCWRRGESSPAVHRFVTVVRGLAARRAP